MQVPVNAIAGGGLRASPTEDFPARNEADKAQLMLTTYAIVRRASSADGEVIDLGGKHVRQFDTRLRLRSDQTDSVSIDLQQPRILAQPKNQRPQFEIPEAPAAVGHNQP